jgi:hypothetical protein
VRKASEIRRTTFAACKRLSRFGRSLVPPGTTARPGGRSLVPPGTTSRPGGRSFVSPGTTSRPGGRSLVPPGTTSRPSGRSLVPPGTTSRPGGRSLVPPGTTSRPGGRKRVSLGAVSRPLSRTSLLRWAGCRLTAETSRRESATPATAPTCGSRTAAEKPAWLKCRTAIGIPSSLGAIRSAIVLTEIRESTAIAWRSTTEPPTSGIIARARARNPRRGPLPCLGIFAAARVRESSRTAARSPPTGLGQAGPEPRPRKTSLRHSPSPAKPGGKSECDGIERRRFRRRRPNRHPREGGGPVRVRRTRTMSRCRLLLRVESCAASPRWRLGTSSGLDPRLRGGDGWARVASTVVFLDRQNAGLAPATPGGFRYHASKSSRPARICGSSRSESGMLPASRFGLTRYCSPRLEASTGSPTIRWCWK